LKNIGSHKSVDIHKLNPNDPGLMESLLSLFGEAFDEPDTYNSARPDQSYFRELLSNQMFVALVALEEECVIGGLAAYELPKFEQERCEYYIYDLAVSAEHRRKGIATALIDELRAIAAARGAHVIFVQADYGDEPAIALYTKLGTRADVMHFDIAVEQ